MFLAELKALKKEVCGFELAQKSEKRERKRDCVHVREGAYYLFVDKTTILFIVCHSLQGLTMLSYTSGTTLDMAPNNKMELFWVPLYNQHFITVFKMVLM